MSLLEFVEHELNALQEKGLLRHLTQEEPGLNFSSNDSLGLSQNQPLKQALLQELEQLRFGSTGSRLLTGNHELHQQFEQHLARFLGKESALLFNSGYQLNTGLIPSMYAKPDLILADKFIHASLIDGIRLSSAKLYRYTHLDTAHLKQLLDKHRGNYRHCLIVTESVFSMDGDKANLASLVDLAKQHNAELLVDEAHAFGLYGEKGKGLSHAYKDDIDFIITTFGKSFGSCGAAVACKDEYKQYLINRCRAFIYSTALPLPVLIWNIKALALIETMSAQRAHLQQLATRFRTELQKKGYHSKGDSHIVPLLLQSNDEAIHLANSLRQSHIHCMPIKHPTVPKGSERLRFSFSTLHQHSDIDAVLHNL